MLGNTDFMTESLCYKLELRGRKYVEVNQTERLKLCCWLHDGKCRLQNYRLNLKISRPLLLWSGIFFKKSASWGRQIYRGAVLNHQSTPLKDKLQVLHVLSCLYYVSHSKFLCCFKYFCRDCIKDLCMLMHLSSKRRLIFFFFNSLCSRLHYHATIIKLWLMHKGDKLIIVMNKQSQTCFRSLHDDVARVPKQRLPGR